MSKVDKLAEAVIDFLVEEFNDDKPLGRDDWFEYLDVEEWDDVLSVVDDLIILRLKSGKENL